MKTLLFLILLFCLFSCGKKKSDRESVLIRKGVETHQSYYRGYDVYGAANRCEREIVERDSGACLSKVSPEQDMVKNFKEICESRGYQVYKCGCLGPILCSVKIDIVARGYDMRGKLAIGIPHRAILECPSSGEFFPRGSGENQEEYRDQCEQKGYKSLLVGCKFKRYLCSQSL